MGDGSTGIEILPLDNVPNEWRPQLEHDAAAFKAFLCKNMELCVLLHDVRKGAKYFLLQLDWYLDAKYPLTSKDRAHLATQVLKLITISDSPALQVRTTTTLPSTNVILLQPPPHLRAPGPVLQHGGASAQEIAAERRAFSRHLGHCGGVAAALRPHHGQLLP